MDTVLVCQHIFLNQARPEYYWQVREGAARYEVECSSCHAAGLVWSDEEMDEETAKLDRPKYIEVVESSAVAKGWLPKSRAMQYLLYVSNDQTAGMAVDPRHKLLARSLHRSGLSNEDQDYLYKLFLAKEYDERIELTPAEEEKAGRLTGLMF
jgi:hypothetical protein